MRLLILFLILSSVQTNAQFRQSAFDNSDEPRELKFETGASLSWSVLSGAWTPGMELSFGFINPNDFTTGFQLGYKSMKENIQNHGDATDASIRQITALAYGGYIFNPNKMWHIRTNIGLGALWEDQKNYSESDVIMARKVDTYFIVDPRIGLEVNINQWMCLDIWAGHSFTTPLVANDFHQKGSPELLIGVQIGRF
jgi:hypothetical protein